MEGGLAGDGRRASMYDPARDIFAQEEEHGGSAERGTRDDNDNDNSTSHGQPTVLTAPAAVPQAIDSSQSARLLVC